MPSSPAGGRDCKAVEFAGDGGDGGVSVGADVVDDRGERGGESIGGSSVLRGADGAHGTEP